MDNFLSSGEQDARTIFTRFKKRNFSGDTGQAIKNSSYQLTTNVIMKVGSLLFTIIIARMLMPEKMGLYSLALSTIVLFSAFSDFGVGTALLTFVAKSLGRGDAGKAKAYFKKLYKWKTTMLFFCSLALLASSYFISKYYYQKPIFYALIAGALYIPAVGLLGFIEQSFRAVNDFKRPMIKEIIFQSLRLTIVPLGIFLLLRTNLSNETIVSGVILLITASYLLSLLFLVAISKKKLPFLSKKNPGLTNEETRDLKKFILPLSATVLSGVFFGYIDTLMLGHFVSENYIAYYGAAFSLVSSGTAIIGFISTALFPLFSKLEGKSLEKLFRKSRNMIILISFFAAIFSYIFAYYLIWLAYGSDYLTAVPIMKIFAILVFILPFSSIYDTYLTSQKKTKILAWLLVVSTILNIILNFFGITYGLKTAGDLGAVYGACLATITSRIFYFAGVVWSKKRIYLS